MAQRVSNADMQPIPAWLGDWGALVRVRPGSGTNRPRIWAGKMSGSCSADVSSPAVRTRSPPVHGERVERGRVVVGHAAPPRALVHVDEERAVLAPGLLHRRRDERDLPLQRHVRVLGVEAELQRLCHCPAPAFTRDGRPRERDALEVVDHGVSRLHGENLP